MDDEILQTFKEVLINNEKRFDDRIKKLKEDLELLQLEHKALRALEMDYIDHLKGEDKGNEEKTVREITLILPKTREEILTDYDFAELIADGVGGVLVPDMDDHSVYDLQFLQKRTEA